MFSTPKLLSTFCIFLVIVNALALLLCILFVSTLNISTGIYLAIVGYLVTSTLVAILMTIGLRDLSQHLNMEYEANTRKLVELKNKITSLEEKLATK